MNDRLQKMSKESCLGERYISEGHQHFLHCFPKHRCRFNARTLNVK